jgi:hypothetical protein
MTSFPAAIKTWAARTDTVDDVAAADVNTIYDEVTAIETKLGLNRQGVHADLITRLVQSLDTTGRLNFAAASTLTISAGSVTPTKNYHRIDTESAAATDNLDTVTAITEGFILVIKLVAAARNVVIRHNIGNIYCASNANITLDTDGDFALLIYDGALSKWLASGVGTKVNKTIATKTANYTVDGADDVIRFTATATATLPAATGNGKVYSIISDGAGVVVTVDGNAAETINRELTQVLNDGDTITIVDVAAGLWNIL